MVLYLDLPCTSFHYGTSVSKHNSSTLCCFAAELNALFPTAGALASKYSVQYHICFFNLILSISVLKNVLLKRGTFSFVHRCWSLSRNIVRGSHAILFEFAWLLRKLKMLQWNRYYHSTCKISLRWSFL